MDQILLLGAGRSATILIDYLLRESEINGWHLIVCDVDLELAKKKVNNSKSGEALKIDLNDENNLSDLVASSKLVISMLPARFHYRVAEVCLYHGRDMLTASYLTNEMKSMEKEAVDKGILMLHECGLDPGIDHMSAMKVIDRIRDNGGKITGFESFTGGLLAPGVDDNPWNYKFTWNPRNVVLAGQGGVKFIQEGRYKYIPYHRLFRRTEIVHLPNYGYFEGYANRDSLGYREVYDLQDIKTMYRGTFRRPGFCKSWDVFVQIGATDDTYELEGVVGITHRQFINSFLFYNPKDSVELKLAHYLNLDMEGEIMHNLMWLGMFDDEIVGLERGTPAQILEHILKKKWTMKPDEADMIVMWHKFNFNLDGKEKEIQATFVALGEDQTRTAMAKTVGLPLGIAAKLMMKKEIGLTGVHAPIKKQIYEPVLDELIGKLGTDFIEEEKDLQN